MKFWLPVFLYSVFVFLLSSIPGEKLPKSSPITNNFFHLIEYTIFGLLFSRALKNSYPAYRQTGNLSTLKLIFLSTFFILIYGLSNEIYQIFVPLRVASLSDVIIDSIGGFLGSLLYTYG